MYTLFLYYLICGFDEKDIFIFSNGIPESIRNNINHIYFPPMRYTPINKANIKNRNIDFNRIYQILKLRTILFFKTATYNTEVYGHAHLGFSFPFYEYENSYIIEDGLGNYFNLKKPHYDNSIKKKVLYFLGNIHVGLYESFGTHENIKKVYLTKNEVPEIIKDKVIVIDREELWKMKSDEEKNKILEIFNIFDVIANLDDDPILLLTQCFSEDRFLPIDEEIKIYDGLIENQKNKNIIIKPHPRENKDYHEIFPELKIINKEFPIEILKCLDISIKKIITVTSTAALNFVDECEIELYAGKTSSSLINSSMDAFKKQIEIEKNK